MKKLLVCFMILSLVLFGSVITFAAPGNSGGGGDNGGCEGPDCSSTGALATSAESADCAADLEIEVIPNGVAIGGSGAFGTSTLKAFGLVNNGTINSYVRAVGGGASGSEPLNDLQLPGDRSIQVGTFSSNRAATGGTLEVGVDTGRRGSGLVAGIGSGFTGQLTGNGSILWDSPRYPVDGLTWGLAGQASFGWYRGSAIAGVIYDKNGNHYANAGFNALIDMYGDSYSSSYRFIDWGDGTVTTGMGTFVGAHTTIDSEGWDYENSSCGGRWFDPSYADAHLDGEWFALGGALSITEQPGTKATALGIYKGEGELGCDYTGSAVGYTGTTVTTFTGMEGSIKTSEASMQVTSRISNNTPR